MSLNPNQYAKLVGQGRAKAINVPWTEEEMAQIVACKNPAERAALIAELRAGGTVEKKSDVLPSTPFSEQSKAELSKKAKELGVKIPRGSTVEEIIALLEVAIGAK